MKKLIKLTESDLNILVKKIINEDNRINRSKETPIHKYVSYYMNNDMSVIFDKIGMDMPVELEGDEYEEIMDTAFSEAKKFFRKYPEEMTDKYGRPFNFDLIYGKKSI